MSNFAYIQYVNYLTQGFTLTCGAGTVTDLDNDDEFDSLDNDGSGWLYAGTLAIDGIIIPVFTNDGSFPGNLQQIYNPGPSTVTWPPTLDTSTFTVSNFALCFAAGTGIATPTGEVGVETLAIGDLVLTAESTSVPVKWIGLQTVFPMFGPADRLMPVRFATGSLGDGLPHTYLTVTANHWLLVEDII